MDYLILPATERPYQVLYLPASPDAHAFQAKLELRFLPGPGLWFLSLSDALTGALLVNQIPLICSYVTLNDLFAPFRAQVIGSLFCVKAVEAPASENPGEKNLSEFYLLWGDSWRN